MTFERVRPINVLAQAEQLQGLRQQNSLGRERIGAENDLRAALQGGNVNEIARFDPNVAGQTQDVQSQQQILAANRMATIAGSVANSANPKAMFEVFRNSPEFLEAAETLGIDFSQIGDTNDPELIRQAATEIGNAASQFATGNQFGPLGNSDLTSRFRDALALNQARSSGDDQLAEDILTSFRGQQVADVGGVPSVIGPGGAVNALSTLPAETSAAEQLAGASQRGQEEATTAEVRPRGAEERFVKLTNEAPSTFKAAEFAVQELDRFTEQAKLIRNHPGLKSATGFGGEQLSGIPGTDAADAAALVETLKSQSFVSALGAMRAASQTGGAVGNVSDAEGSKFENAFVSLLQSQSPEQFVKELDRLIDINNNSKDRIQSAYSTEFGAIPTAPKFTVGGDKEDPPDFSTMTDEQLAQWIRENG